jgi:hypothetical protein
MKSPRESELEQINKEFFERIRALEAENTQLRQFEVENVRLRGVVQGLEKAFYLIKPKGDS